MYETENTHKPQNFIRRHWFVITTGTIGLIVVGIVAGVLIVKVALDVQKKAGVGGVVQAYVTTTDLSGRLHTALVPEAVRQLVLFLARTSLLISFSGRQLSLYTLCDIYANLIRN
jgi:hypothetical protein